MPEDLITLTEAAELLGVSRFKMSRLVREGVLQAYTSVLDRRQRLVRQADVNALRNEVVPLEADQSKVAA